MRHIVTASKVTTIQEALPQLDKALSTWTEIGGGSDYIDDKVRHWFYEMTKAWLRAGGAQSALERRIPSLERLVRDCLRQELQYQTKLVGDAKAEASGKVRRNASEMGTSFVFDILATAPSVRFASAWLKQHAPTRRRRGRPAA